MEDHPQGGQGLLQAGRPKLSDPGDRLGVCCCPRSRRGKVRLTRDADLSAASRLQGTPSVGWQTQRGGGVPWKVVR